jgi:hypothetical protein
MRKVANLCKGGWRFSARLARALFAANALTVISHAKVAHFKTGFYNDFWPREDF